MRAVVGDRTTRNERLKRRTGAAGNLEEARQSVSEGGEVEFRSVSSWKEGIATSREIRCRPQSTGTNVGARVVAEAEGEEKFQWRRRGMG